VTPTLLPTGLDLEALRDLHAALRILQRLALRVAPPSGLAAIGALRAAQERLAETTQRPGLAVVADHDVHVLLTAGAPDRRLQTLLAETRVALLPARGLLLRAPGSVRRRRAEYDAVIDAVEQRRPGRAAALLDQLAVRELRALVDLLDPRAGRVRRAAS
jgi:DNA-binding GntR family transcriptional regulator